MHLAHHSCSLLLLLFLLFFCVSSSSGFFLRQDNKDRREEREEGEFQEGKEEIIKEERIKEKKKKKDVDNDTPLLSVQSPTLYGTLPYLDTYQTEIQSIPGSLNLAYYDVGGEGVAYHSNSEVNLGSCDLNSCDIDEIQTTLTENPHDVNGDGINFDEKDIFYLGYLNSLRHDESASVSYSKWAVGEWAGDRYSGNNTQMIPYIPYWGWLPVGEWIRVTFRVKKVGLYQANLMATCNSGGYISVRIDEAIPDVPDVDINVDYDVDLDGIDIIDLDVDKVKVEESKWKLETERVVETVEIVDTETESYLDEAIGPTQDEAPVFTESHIRIPSSGHYHQWQEYKNLLGSIEFPNVGLYTMTIAVESFDSYPDGQFGNMMKFDFYLQENQD